MRPAALWALLPLVAPLARAQSPVPKTEEQKVLYALGVALGRNVSIFNLNSSEVEYVAGGLRDWVQGKSSPVDFQAYGPKIEALAKNRQAAQTKKFLESATKEKGASSTPSGLVYTELKRGTGASPKATSKVKVHYEGTFIDGTVFDSSIRRGDPAEFSLNEVIRCWTEGLQKMKVGGKAKLVCPSQIAYGDQGRPPTIPGGTTLVFQVELLDILKN